MEGKGIIEVKIKDEPQQVLIDLSDTGKGISPGNIDRGFYPGFTTKKEVGVSTFFVQTYHGNLS